MRSEYDFSGAVRGKYHKRYIESTNVVVLAPDVAKRDNLLLYDLDDHIANRRRTMARRKADTHKDAGQLAIWNDE